MKELQYDDEVRITGGFHKNREGIVKDHREHRDEYWVAFHPNNILVAVKSEYVELIVPEEESKDEPGR